MQRSSGKRSTARIRARRPISAASAASHELPAATPEGLGEWFVADGEDDRAGKDQLADASAVLLGRKTYEGLAAYWSPLKDDWANLINPKPKYVASRTLQAPLEWSSTLLEGDAAHAVSSLKAELPSDLLMYGCGELARTLLAATLVDELRF